MEKNGYAVISIGKNGNTDPSKVITFEGEQALADLLGKQISFDKNNDGKVDEKDLESISEHINQ